MSDYIENLFQDLSYSGREEEIRSLFSSEDVRLERTRSSGQTSGIYDQEEDEWVLVLDGRAQILFVDEGETHRLKKGDHLYIPAGCRHQVTYTSDPCLWLCVFWGKIAR